MSNEERFKEIFLKQLKKIHSDIGNASPQQYILIADTERIVGKRFLDKNTISDGTTLEETEILEMLDRTKNDTCTPQGYLFCNTHSSSQQVRSALREIYLGEYAKAHEECRREAIMQYLQAKRESHPTPLPEIPLLQARVLLEQKQPVFYGIIFPAYHPTT